MALGLLDRRLSRALLAVTVPALALTTIAVASPAAATAGTAVTRGVSDLPKGPAPKVAYLRDGVIHRRDGSTLKVGSPRADRPYLQLLGRTPRDWAVVASGETLLLVRQSGQRRIARVPEWEPFGNTWYLSRDRGRVLAATDEDQAGLRLVVLGLDGRRHGHHFFREYPAVRDFTGSRVVLANARTRVWRPSRGIRTLADRGGTLARWRSDLLFLGWSRTGPTSLRDPGTPPWTTRLTPMDVSPDGRHVLAMAQPYTNGVRRFAVLSMSDGHVVSSWRLPYRYGVVTRWEGDRTILVGINVKRGQTLVRCRIGSGCQRTLAWSARARLTQVPITSPMSYLGVAYY